mmetsp:Transcript_24230/g.61244  ORF Transcript_24230/g.61244 Transcript_24230/m.61244 type:complete len:204 (+) Transcript_24230:465-1076(+)
MIKLGQELFQLIYAFLLVCSPLHPFFHLCPTRIHMLQKRPRLSERGTPLARTARLSRCQLEYGTYKHRVITHISCHLALQKGRKDRGRAERSRGGRVTTVANLFATGLHHSKKAARCAYHTLHPFHTQHHLQLFARKGEEVKIELAGHAQKVGKGGHSLFHIHLVQRQEVVSTRRHSSSSVHFCLCLSNTFFFCPFHIALHLA